MKMSLMELITLLATQQMRGVEDRTPVQIEVSVRDLRRALSEAEYQEAKEAWFSVYSVANNRLDGSSTVVIKGGVQ
uniref:Uncharacterized protein n=1 Tax=viral metagenome TaxID=1070528 RepID=A0A6M3LN74_9ZZZZ